MEDSSGPNETRVDERRGAPRSWESRPMSLSFEKGELTGQTRDLSDSSVFFLADGEMRLTMRMTDESGEEITRNGRLIRYQRMPDSSSGWAIEFDD